MKTVGFAIVIMVLLALAATLFFIPAFRGELSISPFFSIGPIDIRWYGLLMSAGILIAYLVAKKIAVRLGVPALHIDRIATAVIFGGFIGARLYYVIFSWDYYRLHLGEILQIWKGGLAIYGGLIGGALGGYFYSKRAGIDFFKILGTLAVAAPIAQAIGRFGNFFNHEAYGAPTDLPWKMYVPAQFRSSDHLAEQYFHPAFLYEAVWSVLIFLFLWHLSSKKPNGRLLLGGYLVLYSLGRFFIEGLRLDSFFLSGLRVDQIVAGGAAAAGIFLIWNRNVFESQKNR